MTISVIIPTYNERENIQTLIPMLLQLNPALRIIVVDDNSPDGTGETVEKWSKEETRISLDRRAGKQGYASAVMRGMEIALTHGSDLIVQMDADLSHQPQYLRDMLDKINDHDVVVGSRYVPGGGTRHWRLPRRMLSRNANRFARAMLRLTLHDCTSGFRCYRRSVIEQLDLSKIHTDGYAFLIELIFVFQYNKFRIAEIPILFIDRQYGKSKISRQIIFEALWLVLRLSLKRNPDAFAGRYLKD